MAYYSYNHLGGEKAYNYTQSSSWLKNSKAGKKLGLQDSLFGSGPDPTPYTPTGYEAINTFGLEGPYPGKGALDRQFDFTGRKAGYIANTLATYEILDQDRAEAELSRRREESIILDQLAAIEQGFDRQRAEVGGIGQGATQRALDRESAAMGGARASAVSRGLYNTTALDATERGIRSDTDRALLEVDELVSGLLLQIEGGRTGAVAASMGGLAQLERLSRAERNQSLMTEFNVRSGFGPSGQQVRSDPEQPDSSDQLWGAVATAVGTYLATLI